MDAPVCDAKGSESTVSTSDLTPHLFTNNHDHVNDWDFTNDAIIQHYLAKIKMPLQGKLF